jgi:DNA-directed RNA polymerase subunit L
MSKETKQSNSELAKKIQESLTELGHDVSLGHCYEMLAKLAGHSSYNVASAKNADLTAIVESNTDPKLTPKMNADGSYEFNFHTPEGSPIPFKEEVTITFNLNIIGSGTTVGEAIQEAARNFMDEAESYSEDARTVEHNIVDIEGSKEFAPLWQQYEIGFNRMLKESELLSQISGGTMSSRYLRDALAGYDLVFKEAQIEKRKKDELLEKACKLITMWREALKRHNAQPKKFVEYDIETGLSLEGTIKLESTPTLEQKKQLEDEIKKIFNKVFKGQTHIMTQDVVRYGKKSEHIYELSQGDGIDRKPLYGVTVLTMKGERTDLSQAFASLAMAEQYIKSLK